MKYVSRFTSLNRNKENSGNIENSGRWRTARSEENIKLVRNTLESTTNLARICTEKYGRHVELKFAEVVPRRCSSKGLVCNFTELTLLNGCFPVYMLHICRTHFWRTLMGDCSWICNFKKLVKMILKSNDTSPI